MHAQMLARIASPDTGYLELKPGSDVALMVNNLGATTPMELQIVARAALRQLEQQHKVRPCSGDRAWAGRKTRCHDGQ